MSFLDDILSVGKTAYNWYTGSSTSASIARTAVTGYALNQVQKSIVKDQKKEAATAPSQGSRVTFSPTTDVNIPVLYGSAFTNGIITDARLSSDNLTMYVCITLCEVTGNKLSNGESSNISFNRVYWNGFEVELLEDGITVGGIVDTYGNRSTDIAGLIQLYPFVGNSSSPSKIGSLSNGNASPAYSIFPEWTSNHTMNELVFMIVKIKYDATKNVTGIGNWEFKIKNDMFLAGDVLYDYMTNTRYGAGIRQEDIE